jgi:hypothetical protein
MHQAEVYQFDVFYLSVTSAYEQLPGDDTWVSKHVGDTRNVNNYFVHLLVKHDKNIENVPHCSKYRKYQYRKRRSW